MKKLYLPLFMSLIASVASAQTFTSDGLTYKVESASSKSVILTGCNVADVPETLSIPDTVVNDGVSYSVAKIGDNALAECTQIKNLTIPTTVGTIGKRAFAGSDMESVVCKITAPPKLDESTFSAETYEKATLTVYASVLGHYTYEAWGWTKFAKIVTMPDPPFEVDGMLFSEITSERYTVSMVGYVAKNLSKDLVIPENIYKPSGLPYKVKYVGDGALEGAPVKSVVFPNRCVSIGKRALAQCTELDSIVIPGYVKQVGAHLTDGCVSLKVVNILNEGGSINLGTAADQVFSMSDYTLYLGREVTLNGSAAESPFAGDGLKRLVFSAGFYSPKGLFGMSTGLTRIDLDPIIIKLSDYSFSGLPALEEVTFPDRLTTIGNYAFAECPKLKVINLPVQLATIGNGAFAGNKMDSVRCAATTPPSLADDAFSDETYADAVLEVSSKAALEAYSAADGWKKFVNIVTNKLPEPFVVDGVIYTVQSMADKTVAITGYDASSIPAMLELPATVSSEGIDYTVTSAIPQAFASAPLKYVKFPSTMKTLPNAMLNKCQQLDSIVIPASVTLIEPFFTNRCTALKAVVLEPGDSEIEMGTSDDRAFYHGKYTLYLARPVKVLKYPNSDDPFSPFNGSGMVKVVIYPEAGDCTGLFRAGLEVKTAEFAEGCTAVPADIFRNNGYLGNLILPSTLASVGNRAFYNCSAIKEVTFPESLESMGEYAFGGSANLSSVTCLGRIPAEIQENVFSSDTYSNAKLILPKGAAQYYSAAEGWQKFVNVEENETLSASQIETDASDASVVVTDLQGRMIYSGTRAGMSSLNSGIYVVRSGEKVSKILVK